MHLTAYSCNNLRMDLPNEQRLHDLMKIFLKENEKVNLSAFRTEQACWTGNILDSLSLLETLPKLFTFPVRPRPGGHFSLSILDIGTGGGFPLLPLALNLPNIHFTGLDSTQKKIDAVQRIADAMDLKNVELIGGRAETLGHDRKYREQFDSVTARAVAEINVLLEYCSPFVKPGGKIILWKSLDVDQELKDSEKAQKEFHCTLKDRHVYELPGDFGKRQLLIFEKTSKISAKYPRAIGLAKKKPI